MLPSSPIASLSPEYSESSMMLSSVSPTTLLKLECFPQRKHLRLARLRGCYFTVAGGIEVLLGTPGLEWATDSEPATAPGAGRACWRSEMTRASGPKPGNPGNAWPPFLQTWR